MRVLVACEFSGIVRDSFRALGHDAWSCDILPTERPGPHIMDDVRNVLDWDWDLMIAHPPCIYLTTAGNRWFTPEWEHLYPTRKQDRQNAIEFVKLLWEAPIDRIAIENPTGVLSTAWRKPDQIINPYLFGDPFKKRTCLWLKNLPQLWHWNEPNSLFEITGVPRPEPLYYLSTNGKAVNWADGVARTSNDRARTFTGIAKSMAQQWGVGLRR